MGKRQKIFSIQLPYVDNHVAGNYENLRLAGMYLRNVLEKSSEKSFYEMSVSPAWVDSLNDRNLVDYIVNREKPSVIAATLYLWNVERTLDVLRSVRIRLPSVRILVGGPEVVTDHPFLFQSSIPDGAAVGEGEHVFPGILRSLRTGRVTDYKSVAWRKGGRYVWGSSDVPRSELCALLPSAGYRLNTPNSDGIAYMETSRGCPLKCAFCCYNQKRQGVSFITADEVVARAAILIRRGAKEIRFIDPTFNSNPEFENILHGLIRLNPGRRVSFFAELRAEKITGEHAGLLHKANFREIEAGVQSRDPAVLRAIGRPTDIKRLDRGIKLMSNKGIKLTVDVMCGLPSQALPDIRKSLQWASRVKKANVQFLHTLLIPGTALRLKRKEYGLVSLETPPYRVTSTRSLSSENMSYAEGLAEKYTGRLMDSPALRFAGRKLPDLYDEKVRIDLSRAVPLTIPGKHSRRAIIMKGPELYARKSLVCRIVRQAIRTEPHTLWQFVVEPAGEEPLNLFDAIVSEIDRFPRHLLDNMTVRPEGYRRVARRIFVKLSPQGKYGRNWVAAVDSFLRSRFY